MKRIVLLTVGLLALRSVRAEGLPHACGPVPSGNVATEILRLTGARTKLVWERGVGGKGHFGGDRAEYRLMGFDTNEGRERVLAAGPASYAMPLITPDGSQVVFSDTVSSRIHIIDWSGRNRRKLLDGFWALDVWQNPKDNVIWVYAGQALEFPKLKAVCRFRLNRPEERELVWDRTLLHNRLTVSPDGLSAAGTFPWPKCGLAMLPNKCWALIAKGCCPDLAPDGSGRFFHMLGNHRQIVMYDRGGKNRRVVPVTSATGVGSSEIWYPYWTNHVRFLTVCGPFPQSVSKYAKSNVYLGRFNASFTAVESWVQVTDSDQLETMASAWTEPRQRPNHAATPASPGQWPDYWQKHKAFVARAKEGGIDFLFLGDSITRRWDADVWSKYHGALRAANFGIDGDRTELLLWRLQHGELEGIAPKGVVLLIGVNNLIRGRDTPNETAQGVAAVVRLLRQKLPKAKLLLLGVFPFGPADGPNRALVKQVNASLAQLDDGKAIRFLDIGHKFLEADGTISTDLMHDGLHLAPKGYEIWAEAIHGPLGEMW